MWLSFSQLSDLAPGVSRYGCPSKWAYRYRLELPFVGSPALCTGSAIDAGATTFFRERMKGTALDEAVRLAGKVAEIAWTEAIGEARLPEPLTAEQDAAYLEAIVRGLGAYLDLHRETIPAAIQQRHEFTVRSLDGERARMVLGFSDRIDRDGTIVDLKTTGSPKWDQAGEWDADWVGEKRIQLTGYWLARRAEGRRGLTPCAPVVPRGRLEVVYVSVRLRTPQIRTLDLEFTAEDEARVLDAIRSADARAVSGVYPPRPGPACGFCSWVERCRTDLATSARPFAEQVGVPESL